MRKIRTAKAPKVTTPVGAKKLASKIKTSVGKFSEKIKI